MVSRADLDLGAREGRQMVPVDLAVLTRSIAFHPILGAVLRQ